MISPSNNDYWVPYSGEIEFVTNAGDGQNDLRQTAYRFIDKWRGCVDAGSNVAMWTRNLMNDFEKVICFEPNPFFIECWKKNIDPNKNAIIHEVGLGYKESSANLPHYNSQILDKQPGEIVIKTLDSFELTDIDFIKIDVDGYEDLLIKGACETIANNTPVINIEMKRFKRPDVVRIAEKNLIRMGYKRQARTKSDEVWTKGGRIRPKI